MTKTARKLKADLPAAPLPLVGTELVDVEINGRKKKVAVKDLGAGYVTWTPVVTDGINNATLSTAVGTLIRDGSRREFECEIVLSSLGSVSGAVRIDGLPDAAASAGSSRGGITVSFANGLNLSAAGHVVTGVMLTGLTQIHLYVWDSTAGTTAMQATELTASGRLILSGFYRA